MVAYDYYYWPEDPLTGSRPFGRETHGYKGNHVDPLPCDSCSGVASPPRLEYQSLRGHYYSVDVRAWRSITDFIGKDFGTAASNKAWASLVDKVRSGPASLGVSLAEGRESMEMIANRFGRMTRAYRHLRHGRFRPFLRELTIGPKRKHRNMIKNSVNDASSLWLEYSFGWKPLTQDVYDACTALSKPVPGGHFVGKGHEAVDHEYSSFNYRGYYLGLITVKQGGDFFVTNPNLYLAQEMGLANPAQIAWELVPFSFMVDWVFDVGSFLGGYTDFLGITIVRPYTSRFIRCRGQEALREGRFWSWNPPQNINTVVFRRRPGLTQPVPNTHFLTNIGQSWKRAANAASLLGQILTK